MPNQLSEKSLEIYKLYCEGVPIKELCSKYDLSRQRIYVVINRAQQQCDDTWISPSKKRRIARIKYGAIREFLRKENMTPADFSKAVFPEKTVHGQKYIIDVLYRGQLEKRRYEDIRNRIAEYIGVDTAKLISRYRRKDKEHEQSE